MAKEFKEKTITVNLKQVFQKPVTKRAINANYVLRETVRKETRLKEFSISNKINELFWSRGKYNCPRKVTVKIVNEKGKAIIMLPEEKYTPKSDKKTASKAETKTEVKAEPKAPEAAKTEKAKPAEKATAKKETKTTKKE
ncbi:MAG: hypothetical protein WCW44_06395 [archaeon]|jgi:ribosomal protein L31E